MKKLIILLSCTAFFFSCERIKTQFADESPALVELNGEKLYFSDIQSLLPDGLNSEDSVLYVNNYIKKWVVRNLMYEKANKNVSNLGEIDKMVADYRRSLLIFRYQQELVEQKVKDPTSEEIQAYYDQNAEHFKLKSPLIKGLFIKLPKNAPKTNELKIWIAARNDKSLEKIEKYCYQNAVSYEYFGDTWVLLDDLLKKMPAGSEVMLQKRLVEREDSDFLYLLDIHDYKAINTTAPLEFAKDEIKTILQKTAKTKYINDFEDELYKKALKKGIIDNKK
ncbi:MAG: peptidyl-prolyl cis-trans isomerase [Prevotellaceae bacterium]|jgi:hypothetical protein|nr:peptidyl-prolyl cis-trans isomerase [Prevotellaceae bacterium]